MAEPVPNRANDPKRKPHSRPVPEKCAWCGQKNMDWNASFNGRDICNDCEEEALRQIDKEESK